jgi:hypothetical protein
MSHLLDFANTTFGFVNALHFSDLWSASYLLEKLKGTPANEVKPAGYM